MIYLVKGADSREPYEALFSFKEYKEQTRIQGKIKELLQKETRMNLYLLTQNVCNGYDTYDSCVVAAETPEDAALIRPDSTEWGQYIQ